MNKLVVPQNDQEPTPIVLPQYSDTLFRLTRRMFHQFPFLRRWEQTDDVFQNAMIRLHSSMQNLQIVSKGHFLNLAKMQIRRVLLDLARKYRSEKSFAANHHTDSLNPDLLNGIVTTLPAPEENLDPWIELHIQLEALPDDQREIVDLVWYESLSIEEVAKKLEISERTARRRWQMARLHLAAFLKPPI